MNKIHIWFDGGSKKTKQGWEGYGSFLTVYKDEIQPMKVDRGTSDEQTTHHYYFDLPGATSQSAEWKSAVIALTYALSIQKNHDQKLPFSLHGDCENVIQGMQGRKNVKAPHLRPLYERAKDITDTLNVEFLQENNLKVKEILGH